ncbi:MAG: sugar transferase [Chloroflexota bacterium]
MKDANEKQAYADQKQFQLSHRRQWLFYIASLIVNDVVMTALAFLLAVWVRYNVSLPFFNLQATPTVPSWGVIILGLVPLWLIIFAFQGVYQKRNLLGGLQEYSGVFRATSFGMLVIVIFGFLQPLSTPARGWVLLAWVFAFTFIVTGRFTLRRVIYTLRRRGYFLSAALIVGSNTEAQLLAEQLLHWPTSGLAVLGFVGLDPVTEDSLDNELPIIGTLPDLERLVTDLDVEEIILATSALSQEQILDVFKTFGVRDGVNLRLSTGLFEIITTGIDVKEIASVPLVRVNQARLTGLDWLMKSVMDVIMSIGILVLAAPILLLISAMIKLDSPGPVIYRRRVVGIRGRPFDAFKFRTMAVDGDAILAASPQLQAELEATHKLKEDPRVTRVGQFLRKTSLDELPQFVNVLRREMSVVGPRMIAPEELSMYDKWDINLLTVPPGITGLWQVSGRSDLSYEQRVQLDMRYIRNWSILLDTQILLRTVVVVLEGRGAY